MELTKMKLTVARKELAKNIVRYQTHREYLNSKVQLPIEKVICEILHRIMIGNRGVKK